MLGVMYWRLKLQVKCIEAKENGGCDVHMDLNGEKKWNGLNILSIQVMICVKVEE